MEKKTELARSIELVILYCVLLAGAVTFIYPFLWMIFSTVKPQDEIFQVGLLPRHVTFQWYREMFHMIPAMRGLFNSFLVSFSISVCQILFGAMAGYALARLEFRGRELLFLVVLVTMVIPSQLTLIPLYLLVTKFGWLDSYMALIVPNLVGGFSIFLFRQFFLTIPKDLVDAARIDGLSEMAILFRIFLPLSIPAVVTVGILSFMQSWNDVLWPMVVIRDWNMMTLPQMITQFQLGGMAGGHFATVMASTMLMIVPVLVAYVFFQRYFIEGIATSGLKS